MAALRRVEIIIPQPKLEKVIMLLEASKVEGYTVIDKVQGKGNRGTQDGLGLTDAFSNSLIIWYVEDKELEKLREPIRKMLSHSGGVCAISDAQWIEH
jgi:nitrogen regulatory protein PII